MTAVGPRGTLEGGEMSAIESAPSVEAVQRARDLIRQLIADAGGQISVPELRTMLREEEVDDLAQAYAFGLMLSRRQIAVRDDGVALETAESADRTPSPH
jgi:hypothetical protein